jgi:hypothetical protein
MTLQRSSHLWGIKYWAIWYPEGYFVPKFEICTYEGYNADTGTHYFINHKKKGLIFKNQAQLEIGVATGTFKPFLLDISKVTDYINTQMPRF